MTEAIPPLIPKWSTRRVVLATLVVLTVAAGFWLLYHYRLVVFILFVAIVIGIAMRPAVAWLQRRGVSPAIGAILVYLVLLALLIGFGFLVVPLLIEQVATISASLPDYYESLRNLMINSPIRPLWRLGQQLPAQIPSPSLLPGLNNEVVPPTDTDPMDTVVLQTLNYGSLIGWGTFVTLATLLLGFYWILEGQRATRTVLLWMPMSWRDEARGIFDEIEIKVSSYIRGQTLLCLIIGILSLVAYLLIGLPYALVLALIAGLMELVPWIGPVLGALPALLLALSIDPMLAVWVVVATLIIQQLENNVLVPRIMDESVGVNPIVTLLSIAAFGSLLGVLGAILAIPMAAIIQILLDRFLIGPSAVEQETPVGRDTMSVLRYETQALIQDMRQHIRQKELIPDEESDQVEEKIEAIATDLDSILAQFAPSETTA
ncbi:MAG: AI-2E family transporter [Anaerolineae bacterium]|nr:AI-2E family transporter [Anaerolineae bacterium]